MKRYLRIFPVVLISLALLSSCDFGSGTGVEGSAYFSKIASYSIEGITYRAKTVDGILYTMNDDYGLMVFNALIPSDLEVLGYYSNVASDFDISGDYAYFAGDGFEIADLSWYEDIQHMSDFIGTEASDVIVRDHYAYISDVNYGLRILDVSDPYYIYEVSSYFWGRETTEIAMKWPYVLGIYDNGMWIMRVDDPQQISLVADYGIFDSNALEVFGNYVYIAGELQISVIDISQIDQPQEVGYYSFFSPTYDVVAAGSKLFVAAGTNGIVSLDISDPVNPEFIDSYYTSSNAWSLDTDFDYIYAACSNGIVILRFGG